MSFIVYKCVFPSGELYIGITSETLDIRKKNHLHASKKSRVRFHQALSLFKDQVIWSIVALVPTWELACIIETDLITNLHTNLIGIGFNMTEGGEGVPGRKNTDATKKQMSESALKRYNDNPISLFDVWDSNGDYIGQWNNIRRCAEELGLNPHGIGNCLCGINKTHNGYRFARKIEVNDKRKMTKERKEINSKLVHESWEKRLTTFFDVWDSNGNYVGRWHNQHTCAKDLGIRQNKISNCLCGINKTCKGYTFKKVTNADPTATAPTL